MSQTCFTVAINYWHDMSFDCKWIYYMLLRSVLKLDSDTAASPHEGLAVPEPDQADAAL